MEARHLWRLSLSQRISQSVVTLHPRGGFLFGSQTSERVRWKTRRRL